MTGRSLATVVWPRHLVAFNQCTLRYHLQYRRKLRGSVQFSAPLAEGIALHAVMRRWFRSTRAWRAGADPAIIAGWLTEELVDTVYDAPTEHLVALRTVADHAAWCLGQIPEDVDVRSAERELQTAALRIDGRPVRFQARVDLVLEHPDGGIEHIDFKSGAPREDHWIQRGVERLIVGAAHPLTAGRPPTRTTTLYAAVREVDSQCHLPETFQATRDDLRDLAGRMLTDDAPEPTASIRCAWCPYRDAGCPLGRDPRSPAT